VNGECCDLVCLDLPRAQALRGRLLPASLAERTAAAAQALADPTRVIVATALAEGGELCVCDLAWLLGRAPNLVSHHLRTLRAQGLVSSRRDGKLVLYTLTARGRGLLEAVRAAERQEVDV
jgi:DNA-binding transcriptional ArsR family regulator